MTMITLLIGKKKIYLQYFQIFQIGDTSFVLSCTFQLYRSIDYYTNCLLAFLITTSR